jgi:hypothetical protein
MISYFAKHADDRESQLHLYRVVAETLRSRLDPDDALIVASWFDRLAAGANPKAVFPAPKGRKRGSTTKRGPMADGRIPDDIDVTWLVRQAKERHNLTAAEASRKVAEALKMDPRTVQNIYTRDRDKLPMSPDSQK